MVSRQSSGLVLVGMMIESVLTVNSPNKQTNNAGNGGGDDNSNNCANPHVYGVALHVGGRNKEGEGGTVGKRIGRSEHHVILINCAFCFSTR